MNTIENTIRTYIAREVLFRETDYPYPDDASFLDEGVVDSMNVLQIMTFVEEHFGIHIEDEDVVPGNFDSITKLAAYVRRKLATVSIAEPKVVTHLKPALHTEG